MSTMEQTATSSEASRSSDASEALVLEQRRQLLRNACQKDDMDHLVICKNIVVLDAGTAKKVLNMLLERAAVLELYSVLGEQDGDGLNILRNIEPVDKTGQSSRLAFAIISSLSQCQMSLI